MWVLLDTLNRGPENFHYTGKILKMRDLILLFICDSFLYLAPAIFSSENQWKVNIWRPIFYLRWDYNFITVYSAEAISDYSWFEMLITMSTAS